MISEDEDDFMDVDAPYLSNDEELMTDDEDDLTRIFGRVSLSNENSKPIPTVTSNYGFSKPAKQLDVNDVDEFKSLQAVNFNNDEFPEEYRYLLTLQVINESALRSHPELFSLIFEGQADVKSIIDRVVAIICLYWAQSVIECARPFLSDIQLKFHESRNFKSRINPKQSVYCTTFNVSYGPENFATYGARGIAKGRVLLKTRDGRAFSTKLCSVQEGQCCLSIRCEESDLRENLKLDDELVNLYEVPQEFIPVSVMRSVNELRNGFLNQILVPEPKFNEAHHEYSKRKSEEIDAFMNKYGVSTKLTPSQRDAVFAICNKEHKGWPFVVWGPPGTGKTFTISETIQTILKMSKSNRVLICTPSNMASDHVAKQLMGDFGDVLTQENVLRLRSTGNEYYLRDKKFDTIISCNPDLDVYTIPKCFESWRVVICTLGASAHIVNAGVNAGFFSHIFIDEAGQCSEAELFIPLGGLATAKTSVVLCGDPKQLGPVISLDLPNTLKKKFTAPLFRYMEDEHYKVDKRLCCQLVDCFRCHRSLVGFISFMFYENRLLATGNDHLNFNFSGLEMKPDFPIMFVSTNGVESRQPNGNSFCNTLEADICIAYANFLIDSKSIRPDQIGIISPYTYQSRTINEKMLKSKNSSRLRQITVSSVERFQGSEREVIIMTATRTKSLGFMADDLRINTSMTRAKKLLILVGNEDALNFHQTWRRFILYCKENEAVKYWDPMVDPRFGTEDLYVIENLRTLNI